MPHFLKIILSAGCAILASLFLMKTYQIGEYDYTLRDGEQIKTASGQLRFIPGFRGAVPFLEMKSETEALRVVCPRDYVSIPCDKPKDMFRFLAGKAGSISYKAYKERTLSSGDGELMSIRLSGGNEMVETHQNYSNRSTKIIVFIFLFATTLIFFYSIIHLIFRGIYGKA